MSITEKRNLKYSSLAILIYNNYVSKTLKTLFDKLVYIMLSEVDLVNICPGNVN